MVGKAVADSDDEPDSRHLFAELARGQNTLQASVAALADLLGQKGKGEDVPASGGPRKRLSFD
eukprot:2917289-Pyramimonas_sp.AAC.1